MRQARLPPAAAWRQLADAGALLAFARIDGKDSIRDASGARGLTVELKQRSPSG